jgi:hypothetical protein
VQALASTVSRSCNLHQQDMRGVCKERMSLNKCHESMNGDEALEWRSRDLKRFPLASLAGLGHMMKFRPQGRQMTQVESSPLIVACFSCFL